MRNGHFKRRRQSLIYRAAKRCSAGATVMVESVPPREAATLARVSTATLHLATQRGELHQYRENGSRVYLRAEVQAWAVARGLVRK